MELNLKSKTNSSILNKNNTSLGEKVKAQIETNTMKAQFGLFVAIFNKTNGTTISVRGASNNEAMVKTFLVQQRLLKMSVGSVTSDVNYNDGMGTKLASYSELDMPKLDSSIYEFISKNPGVSRAEIAKGTERRISSACGAVNRLLTNGLVFVSGVSRDQDTGRKVELLEMKAV